MAFSVMQASVGDSGPSGINAWDLSVTQKLRGNACSRNRYSSDEEHCRLAIRGKAVSPACQELTAVAGESSIRQALSDDGRSRAAQDFSIRIDRRLDDFEVKEGGRVKKSKEKSIGCCHPMLRLRTVPRVLANSYCRTL